tara:strand:- start:407 stop:733 length:327 start_codon:yes stop_codon:yes gene_type:complete
VFRLVSLEDGKEFYEIGFNLDLFEDPTRKLTIDDVNRPEWAKKFKRSDKDIPNFGVLESSFWERVRVQNKTRDQRIWVISQNYALQVYVTFFKTRGTKDKSFSFEIKP